jgi:hypothetical protein
MATVCVSCVQDENNPCYGVLFYFTIPAGSNITPTDSVKTVTSSTAASTGEVEIAPTIILTSQGDYVYTFYIKLDGIPYNFIVYKSSPTTWTLAYRNSSLTAGNTPWATATASTTVQCIFNTVSPSTSWTILPASPIPNFNINRVDRISIAEPFTNILNCSPPLDVPINIDNTTINLKIDTLYKCLDVKGTEYLNKLKGGIDCSNLELIKLSLILELLLKRDCTDVIPCIYEPTTETYLSTFVNYITKECYSCIDKVQLSNTYSNFETVTVVEPKPETIITAEDGSPITYETGINITL